MQDLRARNADLGHQGVGDDGTQHGGQHAQVRWADVLVMVCVFDGVCDGQRDWT